MWAASCIFDNTICDFPHRLPLVGTFLVAPLSIVVACCRRKDRGQAKREIGFALDIWVMTVVIWWGGYWQ